MTDTTPNRTPALPLLAAPLLAFGILAGCNTIEGAGQDLEAAGEAVADEARETEAEM